MLLDKVNGIMQDEINFYHYSINNVGTKPITSIATTSNNMNACYDKSTLDRTLEIMTLEEHFDYLNQNTEKIKTKVLRRI